MWISYQDDEGGYSSDNAELVRLKIGDTEPESILDLSDGKNLLDVRFYGNNMYILYHEAKGENGDFSAVFLRYDIRTLEYEDINEKLDYPVSGLFTICTNLTKKAHLQTSTLPALFYAAIFKYNFQIIIQIDFFKSKKTHRD